jgi:hypothetical protein
MKTIAFIDIHPQNPICRSDTSSQWADKDKEDKSVIYLFKQDNGEYTYEKTVDYNLSNELVGIDEFYISIPSTILDFRIVNFPFSDREKIKKVLPIELDNLVLGGSEEIVYDAIIPDGDDSSVNVLVTYTGKNILNQILTSFAGRNIDPRVVTSIDLQTVDKTVKTNGKEGFQKSVAEQLLAPREWNESDRITQAKKEIGKPTINLRTGQFVYTKDAERTGRALKVTVVLGFLLALVIHANILFKTIMIKKETTAIAQEMRVLYSGLFPGEKRTIDELYKLKSHIREVGEKNDILTGVNSLRFLMDLSKGTDLNVVYAEIQIEKGLIKLKGESRSMDEMSKVKTKLSEFLTDVSVSDIKSNAQGKILFTVVAKEK